MKLADKFVGDRELANLAYKIDLRASLYPQNFRALELRFGVPHLDEIKNKGVQLLDVEYGSDFMGVVSLLEKHNKLTGTKITISEPERLETSGNGIEDIFEAYKEMANVHNFNLEIKRNIPEDVLSRGVHGVIFWLNMFPDECSRETLTERAQLVYEKISDGGYGLLTQSECSSYETERYTDVLHNLRKAKINADVVGNLGVVGMIGILVKKY